MFLKSLIVPQWQWEWNIHEVVLILPGTKKLNRDQISSILFWIGVPDKAIRNFPFSENTAYNDIEGKVMVMVNITVVIMSTWDTAVLGFRITWA